ncbi:MAG: O-antigen ligase family protein [Candidatus Goldiibacteriota bacterium]
MNLRLLILLRKNILNFIILFIPVVFFQPFFDPFGPAQLMAARLFLPFFFLLYFLEARRRGGFEVKINPALFPAFLYAVIAVLSVAWAMNAQIASKYAFELVLFIFGAYFIWNVSDENDGRRMLFLVFFVHVIMAVYGLAQRFDADIFSWNTNFQGRPMGTIGNPNFFASQLLIPMFLLLSYAVLGKKHKAAAGAGFVVMFAVFLYAKVAGTYIGFAGGMALFAILWLTLKGSHVKMFIKRRKKAAAAALLALIIGGAAVYPAVLAESKRFLEGKQRSVIHRFLMWEAGWLMIKESPVKGKGMGMYRLNFPHYQGILLNDPKNDKYDYVVTWMPHQNYILIASETGILGLGAFLAVVAVLFYSAYRSFYIRKRGDPFLAGAVSGAAALLGASLFNTFYNIPATTLYFFILIFFVSAYKKERSLKSAGIGKKGAIAGAAASAFLIMFSAAADGKAAASNIYLKQANRLVKSGHYKSAINYYERIVEQNNVELCPQTDVAQYYYAAEAYRQAGYPKKAYEYYKKDLEINPYCPEVNNMFGALSGQLSAEGTGSLKEAIQHLETAVFAAPHYETAYINLITAYMAAGDTENAKKTAEKYIRFNGDDGKMDPYIKAIIKTEQGPE